MVGTTRDLLINDKRTRVLLNEDVTETATYLDEDRQYLDPELVKEGISTEAEALDDFDVYDRVPLTSATTEVLSTRWVHKLKEILVKSRLVVRGFEQLWTDALTASPTPSLTTLLTLLTLGISTDMKINTGDVSTAFLHANLTEDIFVLPPAELQGTERCPAGYCWKLKKALYGLRGAPLAWNKHVTDVLTTKLGFRQCLTDACLFIHDTKKIYLLLYVDDLLLLTETQEHSDWFFTELGSQVLLKHTGTLDANKTVKFLGRQLTHRGDNILVRPLHNFIDTLLQLYNLVDCRPLTTTGTTLVKRPTDGDEELSPAEHKTYRTAVGKLMWLSNIRADITFATKELARGMSSPTQEHLASLKHLLRYIAGTKNYGLMLKPSHVLPLPSSTKTSLELHVYCDSDWAGCKTTRKSTSGTVTQLLGCTVHHCSRTQATVALSSTEAEAYALGTGTAEALYLQQLLRETDLFALVTIHVHTDSTGAKAVCTRTGLSPKTKHMQLRYLWLQQIYSDATALLHKVGTLDNLADLLTKFVNVNVLEKLTSKIGLIDLNVGIILGAVYMNLPNTHTNTCVSCLSFSRSTSTLPAAFL